MQISINKSGKGEKIDFAVGGQAVIEGVMMRSPNHITVAVRKESGRIKVKEEFYQSICMRVKALGIPFLRGIINLFEMMVIGTKMLNFSANELIDEEDKTEKEMTAKEKIIMGASFVFSIIFALALGLFLFKFLPLWITTYLSSKFEYINNHYIIFNLIDGILKTSFFIIYIGLLGLLPDLKRVFEYHGAEHKSIYTYENNLELTPDNAAKQSRFHPRCGTSFILIVFLISILVYTFVPRQEPFMLNFFVRLLFLPVIAGISYEFLKWSAKNKENVFVNALITPGLWFQRLTTREPDKEQLEVALMALEQALSLEEERVKSLQLKTETV
jgi:uncharacterized protein YqhQ